MYERLRRARDGRADREHGFTLIELLVVVVIIGILVAIAIPVYLNYQKGAKNKSAQSDLRNAVTAIEQCYGDGNNTYPAATSTSTGAGQTVTLTCGSDGKATINLSSGNSFSYALVAATSTNPASYKITVTNGDTKKSYVYTSVDGLTTTTTAP